MMAGGWNDGEIDKATDETLAFVLSQMNTTGKLKRTVWVKSKSTME